MEMIMAMEKQSEDAILEKLQNRQQGALEEIIKKYTPYVGTIVYNIIGQSMTREDVEETVSSVFFALWQHSSALDSDKGDLRSYLGAMAKNHAINKLREKRPHISYEQLEFEEADISGEPQAELEREEEKSILWELVQQLGEPDSEIFVRYYYYEEKINHIAKCLNLNASTIKTKLARGRQKLKQKIQKIEREDTTNE